MTPTQSIVKEQVIGLVQRYPVLSGMTADIEQAATTLVQAFTSKKKLLVCGNGGSAADAGHIVGELMKSFAKPRPLAPELAEKIADSVRECGTLTASANLLATHLQRAFPAIALSEHSALSSAFANDVAPSLVFAQQVCGYGVCGDVFLGITTSGNSENVINAAITAKALGLTVIGLTGKDGGKIRALCDICLAVPETVTYKIQELHLPIYHAICLAVENALT